MSWSWSWWPHPNTTRPHVGVTPADDPATLHTCPQCGHCVGLLDEHWVTITGTRDETHRATVCSPRCAVLWLEDTYHPHTIGVVI